MLFNDASEQPGSQQAQSRPKPLLTQWERQNLGRPIFGTKPIPTLGVQVTLVVAPRPAERPRFSQFRGAYNSKNYSLYKQRLVELLKAKILEGQIPAGDYAALDADFYLPIPKSWSKREKAAASGQLHRKKPDADNYLKALSDALEEAGVFINDGQVAQMTTTKWYVEGDAEPRIELRLHTYDELINQAL